MKPGNWKEIKKKERLKEALGENMEVNRRAKWQVRNRKVAGLSNNHNRKIIFWLLEMERSRTIAWCRSMKENWFDEVGIKNISFNDYWTKSKLFSNQADTANQSVACSWVAGYIQIVMIHTGSVPKLIQFSGVSLYDLIFSEKLNSYMSKS